MTVRELLDYADGEVKFYDINGFEISTKEIVIDRETLERVLKSEALCVWADGSELKIRCDCE